MGHRRDQRPQVEFQRFHARLPAAAEGVQRVPPRPGAQRERRPHGQLRRRLPGRGDPSTATSPCRTTSSSRTTSPSRPTSPSRVTWPRRTRSSRRQGRPAAAARHRLRRQRPAPHGQAGRDHPAAEHRPGPGTAALQTSACGCAWARRSVWTPTACTGSRSRSASRGPERSAEPGMGTYAFRLQSLKTVTLRGRHNDDDVITFGVTVRLGKRRGHAGPVGRVRRPDHGHGLRAGDDRYRGVGPRLRTRPLRRRARPFTIRVFFSGDERRDAQSADPGSGEVPDQDDDDAVRRESVCSSDATKPARSAASR